MSIAQAFLGEFEQEAHITEKFLSRLPDDKLDWKPHEKSMSAGQLALHIATAPAGTIQMALQDEAQVPDTTQVRPQAESKQQVLDAHRETVEKVRELLPTIGDEAMQQTWTLVNDDGQPLLQMPRSAFIRSIVMNHWIHHRGQFGVFLRLMGESVPSSYGPSGDELPDFLQSAET